MDMGTLRLDELPGLAIGSVIKFAKDPENKFSLAVESTPVGTVAIGRQDSNKAFIILKE